MSRRFTTMAVAALAVFGFLGVRLFQLQILSGDGLYRISQTNSIRLVHQGALRGMILDRAGVPLATSRTARTVYWLPALSSSRGEVDFHALSVLLGEDEARIRGLILGQTSPTTPVALVRDANAIVVSRLAEYRRGFPGLWVAEEPRRHYPLGLVAAHLLGYVAESTGTGLEKSFDWALRGVDGGQQVLVDARGRAVRTLNAILPQPGRTVTLTLDSRTQLAAESALQAQLVGGPDSGAGVAIAMDCRTGAVRAIVSRPAFDPNLFIGTPTLRLQALLSDIGRPLLNRATGGVYPPGSAFKPITEISAAEAGKADDSSRFYCWGWDRLTPQKRCWIVQDGRVHGEQTLVTGMQHSCNIVFYELARRVGQERLALWSRRFGLGSRTGFAVPPNEAAGLVPDSQWKLKHLGEPWYPPETLDFGIGQGFLAVTPLQMVRLYAAIANGGWLITPYAVEKVGETPVKGPSESPVRLALSAETMSLVRRGLASVTQAGGTAYAAFADSRVVVAGKTGTAENSQGAAHAWFAGYAPVAWPELVVVVLVEHGGAGGARAAPVARKIFDAWFR